MSILQEKELVSLDGTERLEVYREFLEEQEGKIKAAHENGAGGIEVCIRRSRLIDELLTTLYRLSVPEDEQSHFVLIANGGYGRGLLNPGSDIDLLLLTPKNSKDRVKPQVEAILYPLWDLGFKVGHAARTAQECNALAKEDPITKTTLFDSRYLAGCRETFDSWHGSLKKHIWTKGLVDFLEERERDLEKRKKDASGTLFLQEPNIKESPGGLRDFHNLLWISDAVWHHRKLSQFVEESLLTLSARRELKAAFNFMHRLRNDVHYHLNKPYDQLTLRLQGEIVERLHYPQKTILRRIEALMRNYYKHARNIHHYTYNILELGQHFLAEKSQNSGLKRVLGWKGEKAESFDGFEMKDGVLSVVQPDLFDEKPFRLLRLFQYCRDYDLNLSPGLRRHVRMNLHLIDVKFRMEEKGREIFQALLEKKGEVAAILRKMHRARVLGAYLPEFGQLECLVQHEFFHRYTADEHTLRCIDELDRLLDGEVEPRFQRYRDLFIKQKDPYALYLALILHDTGRAENVRIHSDASATLANRVCLRLQITGARRRLIMFLVDHHLTLWRFATKRNIDDPEVIKEFAGIVKNKGLLDALLLFTYADSKSTSDDSWSRWKEALILQLHKQTSIYLKSGEAQVDANLQRDIAELHQEAIKVLPDSYKPLIEEHFQGMYLDYFNNLQIGSLVRHLKAIWQYKDRRERRKDTVFEAALQWISYPDMGYTELTIVTKNSPKLLEKIACALAAHEINILSADVYTRPDGLVIDIFRVCTRRKLALTDTIRQMSVVQTLYKINEEERYDASEYLAPRKNYLDSKVEQVFSFPVRVTIDNETDANYTVVEVQALDRIGLLHNILKALNDQDLVTIQSRICTEKGAALDSFYITTLEGDKLVDEEKQEELLACLRPLIRIPADNE